MGIKGKKAKKAKAGLKLKVKGKKAKTGLKLKVKAKGKKTKKAKAGLKLKVKAKGKLSLKPKLKVKVGVKAKKHRRMQAVTAAPTVSGNNNGINTAAYAGDVSGVPTSLS